MKIISAHSTIEAVDIVSSLILEKLIERPSSIIGLATGKTMVPVYSKLATKVSETKPNLDQAFFFMLDEYLGLPLNHSSSFRSYIKKHFILPLGLRESQVSFPPVDEGDAAGIYEQDIKRKGGIDLQLLGIGQNGHVGFNEPGSAADSKTRIIQLSPETLEANKDQFKEIVPSHALSMGIGTIKESRQLIMLATGKSKADVIKYLINHHDDPSCPATYLKSHPHFTLVLDPDAASKINLNI